MSASFLDSLRGETLLFDALSASCTTRKTADFADLCWGDNFDIMEAIRDPGIVFDNSQR
jgi:hypothetical protein